MLSQMVQYNERTSWEVVRGEHHFIHHNLLLHRQLLIKNIAIPTVEYCIRQFIKLKFTVIME